MVRILIGYSGSGKTYKLQEEIAHKDFGGITNAKEIYVDCENYENEFMQKIVEIVKKAKTHNNDITITFLHFLDDWDGTFFPVKYNNEMLIFENTDEILIGKCSPLTIQSIENLLGIRLRPIVSKYDFRDTKYDRLEEQQIIDNNVNSSNVTTDGVPFKICNILLNIAKKCKKKK